MLSLGGRLAAGEPDRHPGQRTPVARPESLSGLRYAGRRRENGHTTERTRRRRVGLQHREGRLRWRDDKL